MEAANEIDGPIPLARALAPGRTGSASARKDAPEPDWMPAEQVGQTFREAGYAAVTKVKADDGHREGEGPKNGVTVASRVDPGTGAITNRKPDDDDD